MLPLSTALWRLGAYAQYRLRRQTRHDVQSPGVYVLADKVLPRRQSPAGAQVEAFRQALLQDHTVLQVTDHGAGPHNRPVPARSTTIAQLARTSARKRAAGELLIRLLRHYRPAQVLELGTNLGIGTAYLRAGAANAHIVSVEGSNVLADLAQQHLLRLQLQADIVHSTFTDYLQQPPSSPWDVVLLDGHHDGAATLRYLQLLLPHMATNSLIVVDDIRWSRGMYHAWRAARRLPGVSVSIDHHGCGLLLCHRHQALQHFVL